MAQKKAFVRYAANKAVPGSLIVRTKAPKVGTWKEVPYDVCCGCKYEQLVTSASFETILHYIPTENDICTVYNPSSYAIVACDNKLKLFDRNTGEIAPDGWYRTSDGILYKIVNNEFINIWVACP